MTDDEFLRSLEGCQLAAGEFGHAAHVRAAYLYLRETDFPEALARVRRTIRNYATHLGTPNRYHETITVAYLALIQQHMYERGHGGGWVAFARDNSELFRPDLLRPFYPQAQLESKLARTVFLLPRSLPTPSDSCA